MTLEYKLKKAALFAAVELTLRRMRRSPERCARNLIELGIAAFPGKIQKNEVNATYHEFLSICQNADAEAARELFFKVFAHTD